MVARVEKNSGHRTGPRSGDSWEEGLGWAGRSRTQLRENFTFDLVEPCNSWNTRAAPLSSVVARRGHSAASKLTAIYHPRQNGAAKPWAARTMRPSWIYSDATFSRMQLLATRRGKRPLSHRPTPFHRFPPPPSLSVWAHTWLERGETCDEPFEGRQWGFRCECLKRGMETWLNAVGVLYLRVNSAGIAMIRFWGLVGDLVGKH